MKQVEEKMDIVKLSIDALWDCPEVFTKQDVIEVLDKKGFDVLDINQFLQIFIDKKLIIKDGETYRIDITDVFDVVYGKKSKEHSNGR